MDDRRYAIPEWPYAWGGPVGDGFIKSVPEDFVVEEVLPFEPEGEGEHVFLFVEKSGENTEFVARQLARHAAVRQSDVGFAGLKDRHAVTRQWFSVWLPGQAEPDWNELESSRIKVLQVARHARKLKRGALTGNRFHIIIRKAGANPDVVEQRLRMIRQQGVPNYFAEQRFGHGGNNVNKALELISGKKVKRAQQSLYLSAVRAFLFNHVLAARVEDQSWNHLLNGEVCKLRHSNSVFRLEHVSVDDRERLESGEIHPTAILWGVNAEPCSGVADYLQQDVLDGYSELTDLLARFRVEAGRRALRVIPDDLRWLIADGELELLFGLPAGSYATALIREVLSVRQSSFLRSGD